MKAVILAAGKGTRMRPLTDDTPKPLLPVAGKPIIQHTIDLVADHVEEIVVVASHQEEEIRSYLSSDIELVEQEEALGTAHAALQAKERINGKTLIINGDDVYGLDMEEVDSTERGVVAARTENPEDYGVLNVDEGNVKGIQEKPENPVSNLVNTGFYIVQEDFFELLEDVERSERGEYEITDALSRYMKIQKLELVKADRWISCSYPWNLIDANEQLIQDIEREVEGDIAESASIEGKVVVEEDAKVRQNTVVEGPSIIKAGAEVGPGAYIREGTVVHRDARIGSSELKNSVIGRGSAAPHYNYIGDSYLGRDVNMGAGSKIANLRNDGESIEMEVKEELMDTGRRKLGAVIGSEARIGINCSIKPGRKIGPGAVTDVNEKIERNLPGKTLLKNGEIYESWD